MNWIPEKEDDVDDNSQNSRETKTTASSSLLLELIELIQNRLRCIRAEIVSHGWKSSSDNKKFSCFFIAWLLSVFISFEESKFRLEQNVIPSIKNSSTNSTSNDTTILSSAGLLKRCLTLLFVDAQSLLAVLSETGNTTNKPILMFLNSFINTLQMKLCESAFEYHTCSLMRSTATAGGGSDELSSCLLSIRKCWRKSSTATEEENQEEVKHFVNFAQKLVKINQLLQLSCASEIGFPVVFRPPPEDEKLARRKMF